MNNEAETKPMRIRTKSTPTTYIQFRQKGIKGTKSITVEGTRDQAIRTVRQALARPAPVAS